MLAQMPTMTIKGNDTGGTANAKDLTKAEVQAFIQDSNNRMVSDSKIAQWDSTSVVIKFYDTQALAIADKANINVGDKIRTLGAITINDGLGSEYIIENSLVNGFNIGNGKYANYLVNSTKTQASGDNSTKIATTEWANNNCFGLNQTQAYASREPGQAITNFKNKTILVESL